MEEIVRNLRSVAERYKNAFTSTGSIRIADMATDCANHIEKLEADLDRYRTAEQEGRLVVLPCKVGDTVWYIADGKVESAELKAIRINVSAEMDGMLFEGIIPHGAYVYSWVIGQMLFLTRAEAEAAKKGE